MLAHRLVKARHAGTALDGEGARRVGGRWNPPGWPIVYCASSLSLAVLELLAHVEAGDLPDDMLALLLEIPDDLPITRTEPEGLEGGWREDAGRPRLRALGRDWLRGLESAVWQVPSVIVPAEHNLLINPAHPAASRIRVASQQPFSLDPRLYRG